MEKLFYEDIHITDFDAKVIECSYDEKGKKHRLILDRTAFFPEEGGQSADKGTLNGYPVVDVQIKNDIITHIVDVAPAQAPCCISNDSSKDSRDNTTTCSLFSIGTPVTGHVDWTQRFDFMQQHSGEHIVSGLVHKHYGYDNVGFHLGLQEVTLDFNGVLSLEQLREIEAEANDFVWQNLPIRITWPTPEELVQMEYRSKLDLTENVRIVEIPGVDTCACCAPHTETTGQIGLIKITNVQSHRGGVRVNILCGKRAVADYTEKQNSTAAISVLLSAKQSAVTDAVSRLKDENLRLRNLSNTLQASLLDYAVNGLPQPANDAGVGQAENNVSAHAILFIDIWNEIAIRNTVNDLTTKYPGYTAIFAGNDTEGYRFIIGSAGRDCRELAKLLRQIFGAKGGGSAPMIQGTVLPQNSDMISLKTALEKFLLSQ
ncbi:MAG: hypothetical protein E7286_00170 [Lachnospiraceae bacterium]|nr:hypothetical protein [Lachnospiraceae bacterium]